MDALFSATLDLIEERGSQVVFGGSPGNATWGANEYGPARPMAGCEFVIDRRYWEMLGMPDKMPVGFANESGWAKWVGCTPPAKATIWLEAFEGGEIT